MEAEHGFHTVKSHGLKVAKAHMRDWLILPLFGVIELILYVVIPPFRRFVSKDMMTYLKYPRKDTTVPFWAVPILAIFLPITVFLAFYFRRRDVYDLHHGVLGLLFATLITGVITDAIKDAAGYPRPDFFWRCFPDGKDVYDQLGNVICHGTEKDIKEGHKTFPSGHASWSFAGLGFLSLYLSGKISVFDGRGPVARLCLIGLPLLVATLVSISLVDDYYHRGLDVFIGGLIGLIAAVCCYLHFFPPPYKKNGSAPREYFRRLEELHAGSTQPATNAVNGQGIDAQTVRSAQAEGINSQYNRGLLEVHDPSLDEMELGRR